MLLTWVRSINSQRTLNWKQPWTFELLTREWTLLCISSYYIHCGSAAASSLARRPVGDGFVSPSRLILKN